MRKNNTLTFWRNVNKTNSCWVWEGALTPKGYGQYWMDNDNHRVHTLAYEMLVGKIPKGLQLDHLCRNRACVNPKHLEVVTAKINVLRGVGLPAKNNQKTHCDKGHEFTPENTYHQYRSWRGCLTCLRNYRGTDKYKARQKVYKEAYKSRKSI